MPMLFKGIDVEDLLTGGNVGDLDVLRLQTAMLAEPGLDPAEAQLLLAVNRADRVQSRRWISLLIDAIAGLVVDRMQPRGYITESNAEWLVAALAPAGHLVRRSELELLVTLLARARHSPVSLSILALNEVRCGIVEGTGALLDGAQGAAGALGEVEVELLRRILYAHASARALPVSRPELEILLAINDAWGERVRTGAWRGFIVSALANAVLATRGFALPSRERALGRGSAEFESGTIDVALARSGYRAQSPEDAMLARLEREAIAMVVGDVIADCDMPWLETRIADTPLANEDRQLLQALARLPGIAAPAAGGARETRIGTAA